MVNYWAIAPWPNDEPETFEQVCAYDRAHGCIAIRWAELGDLTGLTRFELTQRYRSTYRRNSPPAEKMLWDFYNTVARGDFIVARRGLSLAIGIGRVVDHARYDAIEGRARQSGSGSPYVGASFIGVNWQWTGSEPSPVGFHRNTIVNIGPDRFERIRSKVWPMA